LTTSAPRRLIQKIHLHSDLDQKFKSKS